MKKTLLKLFLLLAILSGALFALIHLSVTMPGESSLETLEPLNHDQFHMSKRLFKHVWHLAEEIGERHYQVSDAYNRAAEYIEQEFTKNNLVPYAEEFGKKLEYRNIVAEHYGTTLPDEIIIVGAHYDTVWMSPGADDNASGVAVMLEMARHLKKIQLNRTVRFIAFANEEYPYFLTDNMGSLFHAKRAYDRDDNIIAMLSLEMLGYYSDEPDSQSYPSPFSWFYPDTANFIGFVSNVTSGNILRQSIALFRETRLFPSEGLTAPVLLIPDVRRSDQAAFWKYNYPAFMVTDTAAFRNYAYHNVSDIPNSLNYDHMARITTGLIKMVEGLASGK
ncbi:MAG: M20/M25/M40 family metallo-hydrolase [Proteobacteria bacterium]|nr:M20/M25/M40 family metallo-hydrolase [Pseudomonadota bacterium]